MIGKSGSGCDSDFPAHCNLPHSTFLKNKKGQKIVIEHVYMIRNELKPV